MTVTDVLALVEAEPSARLPPVPGWRISAWPSTVSRSARPVIALADNGRRGLARRQLLGQHGRGAQRRWRSPACAAGRASASTPSHHRLQRRTTGRGGEWAREERPEQERSGNHRFSAPSPSMSGQARSRIDYPSPSAAEPFPPAILPLPPPPPPRTGPTRPERRLRAPGWRSVAAMHGLLPDSLRVASADASFRRYFRIDCADGASRIVMDAPPGELRALRAGGG